MMEPRRIDTQLVEPIISHTSKSRFVFLISGIWLIGLGLYFMLLRPPLLPEDFHYMGTNPADMQSALPGLQPWLRQVFRVLGGFITATGLLTYMVAMKGDAIHGKSSWIILAMTGAFSVGMMSLINFKLDSDYKWLLLLPALLWASGLAMPFFRKKNGGKVPDKQGH